MSARDGTVFLLCNDAMPGFTRVEYLAKGDIASKISQINSAPLPVPFRLLFAAKVNDWKLVKRNIQFLFAEHQDGNDPSFYTVNPDELRVAIEMAMIEPIELSDEDQAISGNARAKMNQLRARHEDFFFKAQLPSAGTILRFSKEPSITCQSMGNGKVNFEGKVMSPGMAALRALEKIGFHWEFAHGAGYWHAISAASGTAGDQASEFTGAEKDAMPEKPLVMEDANDSPVMFIRNKK